MSDHVHDGAVLYYSIARLQAEALADPALADRAERAPRILRATLARWRAARGLPPVPGRSVDPHEGHEVRRDEQGVEVCWTCTAEVR